MALPGLVPPIQFCERRNSPGCLSAPRAPREQHAVDLAEQAVREREAFAEAREAVFEGGHVARHFDHVVERGAGRSPPSRRAAGPRATTACLRSARRARLPCGRRRRGRGPVRAAGRSRCRGGRARPGLRRAHREAPRPVRAAAREAAAAGGRRVPPRRRHGIRPPTDPRTRASRAPPVRDLFDRPAVIKPKWRFL